MNEPHWLLEHASDTYSQAGEDGIIAKILSMLPARDRHAVEFGAWDGKHLSNARRLIEEEDYSVVYIEGNPAKFRELEENYREHPGVTTLQGFVGFDRETGLDSLLGPLGFPKDFDLLSIDIDGNDYHVWKAVEEHRPKLVVIEFNPTIPNEVDFVQRMDPGITQGCSLSSLCALAQGKGYELVCVQPYNAFFVDRTYFPLFGIADNRPQVLRKDLSLITWLFIGYDGSLHLAGSRMMHWHQLELREDEIQILPKDLQTFPDDYTPAQRRRFERLKRRRALG